MRFDEISQRFHNIFDNFKIRHAIALSRTGFGDKPYYSFYYIYSRYHGKNYFLKASHNIDYWELFAEEQGVMVYNKILKTYKELGSPLNEINPQDSWSLILTQIEKQAIAKRL